ncbi:ABC transporter substrate-binding protein [Actinoallomurus spadix]|uniref:Basic amino acid ABC transporter substrate-binding protein n=1 Tax=Actinoallomurus spadix TaxID=79912 RepID=A0ABN0X890_9ACTN|nr:ABC transporter substrate-binding protein [Actinoallomurus spadix]MCO5991024.1 ABC transporter substrate-binding protein [Actinoallomurus spadix]
MHLFTLFRACAMPATAVTACLLAGCAPPGQTVRGVHLVARGTLTTCTHLPYAPFQFQRGKAIVGFDVDLIDLVARRLGVRQKIVDTRFTAITSGEVFAVAACDVAAAGMTISPQRATAIDFSRPYFDSGQVLMARRDARIAPDSLGPGGVRVGVVVGTTGQAYARRRGWQTKGYENATTELDALRTGQVDALVQDDPVVRYWLTDEANAGFTLVPGLLTHEQYGFAVRKGHNPALLRLIDDVIARIRRDGTYRRTYERWMGPMPPESTG